MPAWARAAWAESAEPLMAHFGVNVRCLVAISLLILAEGTMGRKTASLVSQFVRNGLVTEAQRGTFVADRSAPHAFGIRRCRGLRCSA